MSDDTLDPQLVLALSRITGIPVDDTAMAERIAGGAGSAIAAVRACMRGSLFEHEPADYLPLLERLAVPPVAEGGES